MKKATNKAQAQEVYWKCGHGHPCVSVGCCVVVVAGPKEKWVSLEKRLEKARELADQGAVTLALDVRSNPAALEQLDRLSDLIKARLVKIIK